MCFSRMVAACHTHSCIECCLADQISLTSMLYRVAAAICARAPATMSVSAAFESCPNLAATLAALCLSLCYSSCSFVGSWHSKCRSNACATSSTSAATMEACNSWQKAPGTLEASYSIHCRHLPITVLLARWLSFGAIMCNVSFARNPRYVVQALQPQAAHGSHALWKVLGE